MQHYQLPDCSCKCLCGCYRIIKIGYYRKLCYAHHTIAKSSLITGKRTFEWVTGFPIVWLYHTNVYMRCLRALCWVLAVQSLMSCIYFFQSKMRWSVLVRIVCQLTPLYRVREISEEFHYLFVLNQSKIFDFNNGTF